MKGAIQTKFDLILTVGVAAKNEEPLQIMRINNVINSKLTTD